LQRPLVLSVLFITFIAFSLASCPTYSQASHVNHSVVRVSAPQFDDHVASSLQDRMSQRGILVEIDSRSMSRAALENELVSGAVDVLVYLRGSVDTGLLIPLDEFIAREPDTFRRISASLDGLRIDGRLFHLPLTSRPLITRYNLSAFEEAGLPKPDLGWTWDDFHEAVIKLTRYDSQGSVVQYGSVMNVLPWDVMVKSASREPFEVPAEVFRRGISILADLLAKNSIFIPEPLQWSYLFEVGNAALELTYLPLAVRPRTDPDFQWGLSPIPGWSNSGSITPVDWLVTASISSQSTSPQAAWEVVRFLSSPEGAILLASAGRDLPFLISEEIVSSYVESLGLMQKLPELREVLGSLQLGGFYPPYMGQLFGALNMYEREVIFGGMSAEFAADQALLVREMLIDTYESSVMEHQ